MTNSLDIIIYADSINEGHSAELSDDEARKVKSRVALHLNMSEYNEYEATKIWEERRNWIKCKLLELNI